MARDRSFEDLRKDGKEGPRVVLSMSFAIVAAAVLASSGFLAALILPELFAREGPEPDPETTELSVLLSLTLDRVVLEDRNLSNLPLQSVLIILIEKEGAAPGSEALVREFVTEGLTVILGEGNAFAFKVYSVQSEVAMEVISLAEPPSDQPPTIQTVELRPSHQEAGAAPITVKLELWPRGSD